MMLRAAGDEMTGYDAADVEAAAGGEAGRAAQNADRDHAGDSDYQIHGGGHSQTSAPLCCSNLLNLCAR
jgi:hypothetical protein